MNRYRVGSQGEFWRAPPRHKWYYTAGRWFRVIGLWRWLIVRIERKGQQASIMPSAKSQA